MTKVLIESSELTALRSIAAQYRQLASRLPFDEALLREPSHTIEHPLPLGAAEYLSPSNPRLLELKNRYRARRGGEPVGWWSEERLAVQLDLCYFRGDNHYQWQLRDRNFPHHFLCTYLYLRASDSRRMFSSLNEDGAFGCYVVDCGDGVRASRDLLDSISEMQYLDEFIGLERCYGRAILDIGAGYGRFAYRLLSAVPGIGSVYCFDAIAESSFLCEFYLAHRGISPERATVVLWDEISGFSPSSAPILAVNMHSFSECRYEDIEAWMEFLGTLSVEYVMIVPNRNAWSHQYLRTREADGDTRNYYPLLEKYGYQAINVRAKYQNAMVQNNGVSPTHYLLFRRN
jgi:hypothetical protein